MNTKLNSNKQFASVSTSTALKKLSTVATETTFSTSTTSTQTIRKEMSSCDTQTSFPEMLSVATQTSPIVIKKRTVGIQSAIHKNQTVATQTRKPKTSFGGTQTMELKDKELQTMSVIEANKKNTEEQFKLSTKSTEWNQKNKNEIKDFRKDEVKNNIIDDDNFKSLAPIVAAVSPLQRSSENIGIDNNEQLRKNHPSNFEYSERNKFFKSSISKNLQRQSAFVSPSSKLTQFSSRYDQQLSSNINAYKKPKNNYVSLRNRMPQSKSHQYCQKSLKKASTHYRLDSSLTLNKSQRYQPEQCKQKQLNSFSRMQDSQPSFVQYRQEFSGKYQQGELSQYRPESSISKSLPQHRQDSLFLAKVPLLNDDEQNVLQRHRQELTMGILTKRQQELPLPKIPPQYQQEFEISSNTTPLYQQELLSDCSSQLLYRNESKLNLQNYEEYLPSTKITPEIKQILPLKDINPTQHIYEQSDTFSNQSRSYKEHVYAQEDPSAIYFSSTSAPILQQFFNDSQNSTYSTSQAIDNNKESRIEEHKFDKDLESDNTSESVIQSSLEYSPSMIERVLNFIHGR